MVATPGVPDKLFAQQQRPKLSQAFASHKLALDLASPGGDLHTDGIPADNNLARMRINSLPLISNRRTARQFAPRKKPRRLQDGDERRPTVVPSRPGHLRHTGHLAAYQLLSPSALLSLPASRLPSRKRVVAYPMSPLSSLTLLT